MRKSIFLIAAFAIFLTTAARAQRLVRYQGEINGGYLAGCDYNTPNFVTVHLLNGIAVGDFFSTGIGVGIEGVSELFAMTFAAPVFVNVKGYLPVRRGPRPFLSFDIGASIGLTGYASGQAGMLYAPALGCAFNVGKKEHRALLVSVGFHVRHHAGTGGSGGNMRSVSFGVGYQF